MLKLEVVSSSSSMKKNQPPIEHDIIINGYLSRLTEKRTDSKDHEKSDDNLRKNGTKIWRRRWFVLKSDYCLYWYKSSKVSFECVYIILELWSIDSLQNSEPVGAISLQGYCAGVSHEPIFNQQFAFRLVRYGSTHKYFAANDADTAGQWVNALNSAATRINQVKYTFNCHHLSSIL